MLRFFPSGKIGKRIIGLIKLKSAAQADMDFIYFMVS